MGDVAKESRDQNPYRLFEQKNEKLPNSGKVEGNQKDKKRLASQK